MRYIYSWLLMLTVTVGLAQVRFDQLPKDLQLYPRNSQNQAAVPVSGTITTAGNQKIGMQLWREGVLSSVVSQTLSAAASSQPFLLSATIKAEPAEYRIRLFLYKNNDSTLLADRRRIVCGDVYLFYGQSNAIPGTALAQFYTDAYDDRYLRNCTYSYGTTDIPGSMSWYAAKDPFASVGSLGLNIQRLILQQHNIPTAVINGAIGGATITELAARDPANHANLSTAYGRLLYRTQWAGVQKQIKAIIWRQGEAEAGDNATGYGDKFTTFYNQLREDYGNARLYVAQINLLGQGSTAAGTQRDFQRRTRQLFTNVESIATVGARDYDGIHYGDAGYRQLAYEQFRLLSRDFYGSTDTAQVGSPDVRKVFYNARRDSITLVFEEPMQMVWADTAYYSFATGAKLGSRFLKDLFLLDNKSGQVAGGSASGNRVTLRLGQASTAQRLTYMPPYFADALSPFYNGTTLRNSRGMRAFTFADIPIADRIATPVQLVATPVSEQQTRLSWTAPASSSQQIIERATGQSGSFQRIGTVSGTANTFVDTSLPDPYGLYRYRVQAFSLTSESDYSNVASARLLILALSEQAALRLYPNPVGADRRVQVDAGPATISTVVVRNAQGQAVSDWRGRAAGLLQLPLEQLPAGLYIIDMTTSEGQIHREKLLLH